MGIKYFIIFISFLLISAIFTIVVRKVALRFGIVDKPGLERKIHKEKIPLLGGMAIFFSFFLGIAWFFKDLTATNLNAGHWLGFFMGAVFLMIGGYFDDKYGLSPKQQFVWPLFAILAVIAGGIGIDKVSNPLGGLFRLDQLRFLLFECGGQKYYFMALSDSFTILWLMGMMYTTKLLDGLDGLVTGISGIGGLIIFLFTMTTRYYQPDIGLVALIFAACCFGFLIFNFNPAKIFLGEGGSLLLGFILGVLAIISGGKIAIALLILGIPILDVCWTILRRLIKRQNIFQADRKHLHFRLLDLGLGQKKTVLIFYLFSIIFGLSGLFLQSKGKLMALGILVLIMAGGVMGFGALDKKVK